MKLWKVLARNAYTNNKNFNNCTEMQEFPFHSPTLSSDPNINSNVDSGNDIKNITDDVSVTSIQLRKQRREALGIVIATPPGPSDGSLCPSISSFKPGSPAERCDQLTPGDRIRSVNGISTSRMRTEELCTLLDNVLGETATLEVEYTLPDFSSQNSLCVTSKKTSVTLERVDGSIGITLRGGAHLTDPVLNKPIVITHVRPYGPAHRCGRIKVGDRLLKVDNHNLSNKTLSEAYQLLTQPHDSTSSANKQLSSTFTTLTIEYDVNIMESVKYATGPLLVEIERHLHEELGLLLSNYCDYITEDIVPTGIYIESIIPASIADRCGALHVGDQILAVNETYVDGSSVTPQEVMWLLQNYNNNQDKTKLQIMPYYTLTANNTTNWIDRGFGPSKSPTISGCGAGFSTLNSRKSHMRLQRNSHLLPKSYDLDMLLNISTSAPLYGNRHALCHVETLTVILVSDEQTGYGILMSTDTSTGDQHQANIVITHITIDSPAYRCGCLEIGDRIISVNGQCSLTLEEIRAILDTDISSSTSSSRLILQTEFDVTDTVVPTSGIFTVKLPRNGPDLGITITASKTFPDDPFLISNIRRGSAAHRTGTLHAGDHVLAIDNRPLDHVSLEAAFDFVQNIQSNIITLRIQKGNETERQKIMIAQQQQVEEIVYTVELNRFGGPLGITISGSEDQSEPIVLSALTQGGLAEKTGALHVNDRILAINGESLNHRPLSDAIRLLQTSGDQVQLKIARQIQKKDGIPHPIFEPNMHFNYSSPGLASIDSAVESWDSSLPPDTPNNNELSTNNDITPLTLHHSQLLFYSDVDDNLCPSPLPLPNYDFTNTLQSMKYDTDKSNAVSSTLLSCTNHSYKTSLASIRYEFQQRRDLDTYSEATSSELEIHHVILYKDNVYDDYGFSVSDGLYEKGVYINRIRRGGPAHLAGVLKPYDRILQVNETRTKDFDCCLTVPLIASAGDKIELIIARNPYIGYPEEKDMHVLSWSPDQQDLSNMISSKSFSSSQNTITI